MKKLLSFVLLFFMTTSVPVSFFNCRQFPIGYEEDAEVSPQDASVQNPTNNYYVVGAVYYIGGLSCAHVNVAEIVRESDSIVYKPVDSVRVMVNGAAITDIDSVYEPFTATTLPSGYEIDDSVEPGDQYDILVIKGEDTIARGNTTVPREPVCENIATFPARHAPHAPLLIAWRVDRHTSSVSIELERQDVNDTNGHTYSTPALDPDIGYHFVPAAFFKHEGTYSIIITAYNGIPPEFRIDEVMEDMNHSYNISGAAGYLISLNQFSQPYGVIVE